MKKLYIGLLIMSCFLFSCKKPFERACFKGSGDQTITEIPIPNSVVFDSLYLYDNIEYTLIPSDKKKVVLQGGENLLPFIAVDIENGNLSIRDKNKCDFLRPFKNRIRASIYVDTLRYIKYEGSAFLYNEDTLRSNELRVVQRDGAGEMDLVVKNGYTSVSISSGFGNFYLGGNAILAYLNCSSNSYCDASAFTADQKLTVNSNTVGEMKVNANTAEFKGIIHQSGNIKYFGAPLVKNFERIGNGQFIYLGE